MGTLAAGTGRRCHHCGSSTLVEIRWADWIDQRLPRLPVTTLVLNGQKPIPDGLTYCDTCHEWLPASGERTLTEELIAAMRLVNAAGSLAGARLESSDRPDIVVRLRGATYGLEITRIARGGSDAMHDVARRDEVARKARILWLSQGRPTVSVNLLFHHVPPREKIDEMVCDLVDEVARLADTLSLDDPRRGFTSNDLSKLPDALAEYLNFIQVARNRTNDTWGAGWGNYPDVQRNEVQTKITYKSVKASSYPLRRDGLWLLVYADTTSEAQALDLSDEIRSATFDGKTFDRVFFLDCRDQVAELRLEYS